MRFFQMGQLRACFLRPASKWRLNSAADFEGNILFSPVQMLSAFASHSESFSSPPAIKSM